MVVGQQANELLAQNERAFLNLKGIITMRACPKCKSDRLVHNDSATGKPKQLRKTWAIGIPVRPPGGKQLMTEAKLSF